MRLLLLFAFILLEASAKLTQGAAAFPVGGPGGEGLGIKTDFPWTVSGVAGLNSSAYDLKIPSGTYVVLLSQGTNSSIWQLPTVAAYDACDFSSAELIANLNSTDDSFVLPGGGPYHTGGEYYYGSNTVSGNATQCHLGVKVHVSVPGQGSQTNSTSKPSNSTTLPSGSTPPIPSPVIGGTGGEGLGIKTDFPWTTAAVAGRNSSEDALKLLPGTYLLLISNGTNSSVWELQNGITYDDCDFSSAKLKTDLGPGDISYPLGPFRAGGDYYYASNTIEGNATQCQLGLKVHVSIPGGAFNSSDAPPISVPPPSPGSAGRSTAVAAGLSLVWALAALVALPLF